MIVKINLMNDEVEKIHNSITSIVNKNDQYILEDIFGDIFCYNVKDVETIVIG